MRLLDITRETSEHLERAGIDDAYIDAELLVLHAAGIDRLAAFMENPEIGKNFLQKIRRLTRRRSGGEPLQYITGHVDFLGLRIEVGRGVLIPRPETELVAQEAISEIGEKKREKKKAAIIRILDLCTGSGCIGLSLAREFPTAAVYGTDVSKTAIRYAKKNQKTNGIKNIRFLAGPFFEPVKKESKFDLIISNPPYIASSEIKKLQREIREWEPAEALDGGEDGLDFYKEIFSRAAECLLEGGKLVLELGFGQADAVKQIAAKNGFTAIETTKDYAGIERIFKAVRY
jgi:release factor glutamine methyltransferase